MLQREKGERKFQKQMLVAERQEKEIKACYRGRREKGSFRTKETNDGRLEGGERDKSMLQREKGERKFQKQMMVAEREETVINACCRERRNKGILEKMMVADGKRKEIKALCRGRREKKDASETNVRGRGKSKGMLQNEKGERKVQKQR
jgi:hypothetical protein